MDLQAISDDIIEFVKERDWEQFHDAKNLSMALGIEVAELQEHFQWLTSEQATRIPQEKKEPIGEEIADVFIYLLRICQALEIDLEASIKDKMHKNRKKYPVEKAKQLAKDLHNNNY